MRVLQPNQFQVRLGWIRVLAKLLVRDGVPKESLYHDLLLKYGEIQDNWVSPQTVLRRRLNKRSSSEIARMASSYGLLNEHDRSTPSGSCVVLNATDPWATGQSMDGPMVWPNTIGLLGLRAVLFANASIVVPLLVMWNRRRDVLHQLEDLIVSLLTHPDAQQFRELQASAREVNKRITNRSESLSNLGRPWLEPLLDLSLLQVDEHRDYQITPRGERLAQQWRSVPGPLPTWLDDIRTVDERIGRDWAVATGEHPEHANNQALDTLLNNFVGFDRDIEKTATIEEFALWANVHWSDTHPGRWTSPRQLVEWLGSDGNAARHGIRLMAGVHPGEQWLRWPLQRVAIGLGSSRVDEATNSDVKSSSDEVVSESALATSLPDFALTPVELLTTQDVVRPAHPASPTPGTPNTSPNVHTRAWMAWVVEVLRARVTLAMGGPGMWLRQIDHMLHEPEPDLLMRWRNDGAWEGQHPTVSGLMLLCENDLLKRDGVMLPWHDLKARWIDQTQPTSEVRGASHECRRSLARLREAMINVIVNWRDLPSSARDVVERWPDVQRLTGWLLADAHLLDGLSIHSIVRDAKAFAAGDHLPLMGLMSGVKRKDWEVTLPVIVQPKDLTDSYRERAFKQILGGLKTEGAFSEIQYRELDEDSSTGNPNEVHIAVIGILAAPSEGHAKERATDVWERLLGRAQFMLSVGLSEPVTVHRAPEKEITLTPTDSSEALGASDLGVDELFDDAREEQLGIEVARRLPNSTALSLFDEALRMIWVANPHRTASDAEAQLTGMWMTLEKLIPAEAVVKNRAVEAQQRAAKYIARWRFATTIVERWVQLLSLLHLRLVKSAATDEAALRWWRELVGEHDTARYVENPSNLTRSRIDRFGTVGALAIEPEDALARLASLASPAHGEEVCPLEQISRDIENESPLLAMELRSLGRALTSANNLSDRLKMERKLAAGMLVRAYRVRNRAVHGTSGPLHLEGEQYSLLTHLLHRPIYALINALSVEEDTNIGLAERWSMLLMVLNRVELRPNETEASKPNKGAEKADKKSDQAKSSHGLTVSALLKRSRWPIV